MAVASPTTTLAREGSMLYPEQPDYSPTSRLRVNAPDEELSGNDASDDARESGSLLPYARIRRIPWLAGASFLFCFAVLAGAAAWVGERHGLPSGGGGSPPPSASTCIPTTPLAPVSSVQLLHTNESNPQLTYPVMSREYPEHPGYLFVTQRGGGGLTILDIASDESNPQIVSEWRAPGAAPRWSPAAGTGYLQVEGQDQRNGILVICGVGAGTGLWVLDSHDPLHLRQVSFLNLTHVTPDGGGPLHVKLYRPSNATDRLFAIVTMGWVGYGVEDGSGRTLLAVDVTDPEQPFIATSIGTPGSCLEGVYIIDNTAFIGGFCSTAFVSVLLGGLVPAEGPEAVPSMRLGEAVWKTSYVQMVSDMLTPPKKNLCGFTDPVLLAALWATPGGIGVFNASSMLVTRGTIQQIGAKESREGGYANRVHARPDGFVLTPLEHGFDEKDHRGGFALYDVTNPTAPTLLTAVRLPIATRVYCAAFSPSGQYVYVFGADTDSLTVYELTRGDAPTTTPPTP